MRLKDVSGRLRTRQVNRFLIDWDGKSRSNLQFKVKQFLKPFWKFHIVYEEFPVYGSQMKVDILNATYKFAVEVNGEQHSKYNPFFHNKNRQNFLNSLGRDEKKRKWAELNEFKFIEIEYNEVKTLTKQWFEEKFDVYL